jgi:hypothetical protein
MHQFRRETVRTRTTRLVSAALTASILALFIGSVPTSWSPVCATFSEGSVEWYLFLCFVDPPPPDPHG